MFMVRDQVFLDILEFLNKLVESRPVELSLAERRKARELIEALETDKRGGAGGKA